MNDPHCVICVILLTVWFWRDVSVPSWSQQDEIIYNFQHVSIFLVIFPILVIHKFLCLNHHLLFLQLEYFVPYSCFTTFISHPGKITPQQERGSRGMLTYKSEALMYYDLSIFQENSLTYTYTVKN